jgi:hypothetical protein
VGIIPALITFVEGIRRRGHPVAWLSATTLIYVVWVGYLLWAA